MAKNLFQTDQMEHVATLSELAPTGEVSLDTLFPAINNRVKEPLALSSTGQIITVGSSIVIIGPDGKKKGLPPLKSIDLGAIGGTFDLATGTGTGDVQSITLPSMTASYYVRLGFEARSDKKIYPMFGAQAVSSGAAGAPGFSKGSMQAGEILLQDDGSGGQGHFANPAGDAIIQFGTGGGGGSGTGVGTLNYVENYDAETDTQKWQTYKDGDLDSPTDGIGGTPSVTLTRSTSTPLRGTASFLLAKPAANVRGEGASTDLLVVDRMDQLTGLEVSFDYTNNSATDSDFRVYIVDVTAGGTVLLREANIPRGTGRFRSAFTPIVGHDYRLCFHVATTSATAMTIRFDDVNVNPVATMDAAIRWASKVAHGFAVGEVVNLGTSGWELAQAVTADDCTHLAIVVGVPDANSFLFVDQGRFHLPSNLTVAPVLYLSETTAGALVTTTTQKFLVPVVVTDPNNYRTGYFCSTVPVEDNEKGDLSFRVRKVSSGVATLRGGLIRLDSGEVIASGSAATEAAYKSEVSLTLATVLGASPANNTTYWLYIDRSTLTESTVTESGRKVWLANSDANYKLLTTSPDRTDSFRYVEVGYLHSADSGTSFEGTGAYFGYTPTRNHNPIVSAASTPQTYSTSAITSAGIQTLSHALSGEPQQVSLFFFENSTGKKTALDVSSFMTNKNASQLVFDFTDLTFNSGDYVNVQAVFFPNGALNQLVSASTQFESGWYVDTTTTTVVHNLADKDAIRGLSAIEWDVTTGRQSIVSGLITGWDNTNVYLDWSGFTPSATLKYKLVAGGTPLPYSIPYAVGGYTKFVGFGAGSYGSLDAALAAAVPGDRILVMTQQSITATIAVSVSDIAIDFMPQAVIQVGAAVTALSITGSNVDVKRAEIHVEAAYSITDLVSIAGDDCNVDALRILVNHASAVVTNGINFVSGSERCSVNGSIRKPLGTVTNSVVDNGTDNYPIVRG